MKKIKFDIKFKFITTIGINHLQTKKYRDQAIFLNEI
jgi:hypothetical protein